MAADWFDEFLKLIADSGVRVTFDPERDITKPCFACGSTSQPRALVDVGNYLAEPRAPMTRPICPDCATLRP